MYVSKGYGETRLTKTNWHLRSCSWRSDWSTSAIPTATRKSITKSGWPDPRRSGGGVVDADVVALLGLIMAAGAGLAAIEVRELRRPGQYQRLEIRFGREVTVDAITAILERVAASHRYTVMAIEASADRDGIRHFLEADQATVDVVRGALRSHLPTAQLLPAPGSRQCDVRVGGAIRLRGRLGTLRTDNPGGVSSGLLGALQPLGASERVVLRWLVRPAAPALVPGVRDGQLLESEERRRIRAKNEAGVLLGHGTLAVQAGHPQRGAHLLARVTSVLRTRNTAYGQLRTLPRPGFWVRWLLGRRSFTFGDRYGVGELVGLLGWPLDTPTLPGVRLGTSPQRMPDARLPRTGRVIGAATWPGSERPIAQPVRGALSHTLIAGPTGVGKSTLLANLAVQDMTAGHGLVLVDSKGDTVDAVLERVPRGRERDVIVLDCASAGPVPGLRLFSADGDRQLAADVVLSVFADLFRDSWGVLSERYLRAGLVAVAHDRGGTLADVPFVFTDAAYRRKIAPGIGDPLSRATLESFEAMSAGERAQQLASTLNKLSSLLGRPVVRTVLGQADPALDLVAVLRERKIVVVSLSPAQVGAAASRLIGAVLVFALFQAVQRRGQLAESARRPFMVYIDEPKALGDLPMPLDALLEQARGLGVGVTIAPQSLAQLPKGLREAVLTNAATRIVFRQNADDARVLAKDLAGVSPEDLQDLAAYEVMARIGVGPGDMVAPVTVRTTALPRPTADPRTIRAASEAAYGKTVHEVDRHLSERHTTRPKASPGVPGRTRRRSA